MKPRKPPLPGEIFGTWRVLDNPPDYRRSGKLLRCYVLCECECGNHKWMRVDWLKRADNNTCRQCADKNRTFRILNRPGGVIYLLKNNKNGMGYVGQSLRYEARLTSHKWNALNENKSYDLPLYVAIREDGWEAFSAEILGEFPESELDEMEQHFISSLRTLHPRGYNLSLGGKGRAR